MKYIDELKKKYQDEFKKYWKDYWYVHDSYRKKEELLKVQQRVNESINNIKQLIDEIKSKIKLFDKNNYKKSKKNLKNMIDHFDFLIRINHLLVDDLIVKYVCENDCALFNQLIDDNYAKNSFDYKKNLEYLDAAKRIVSDDIVAVVICDLGTFNLKCGDIVFYSKKDGMNYIELKTGEKNAEIIKMIIEKKDYQNVSRHDLEQIKRIKKQFEKHKKLDEEYMFPMFNSGRFFELNSQAETFLKQLKKDIVETKGKIYKKGKVDEAIDYLILFNDGKKHDELNETLEEYDLESDNCFTYNEFIFDPTISRPYEIGWGKRIFKKILLNEVIIIIRVNLKELFLKLKEKIPMLQIRKASSSDYNSDNKRYLINGRIIYFNTKTVPFYIGNNIILRIASRLYTTEDTINHYYYSILKYMPEVLS